jgi:hypothetical protein
MARIAGGFIVNGIDQSEKASFFGMIDAGFAIGREENLRFSFSMANITGLRLLIDHCTDFGLIRRDSDLTLFVKNPDLRNSFSLSDIIDDPLIFVPSVLDHGVPNAQTDGLAEVKSFLFCFVKNLSGERVDIEIEEKSFDH